MTEVSVPLVECHPVAMYLPTREAYARDRYQVWQTRAAPGSLEALIETVDARIGKVLVQQ
jgi:hypothetical protein